MTIQEHNETVAALVAQVRANYASVTRRKGEPVMIERHAARREDIAMRQPHRPKPVTASMVRRAVAARESWPQPTLADLARAYGCSGQALRRAVKNTKESP